MSGLSIDSSILTLFQSDSAGSDTSSSLLGVLYGAGGTPANTDPLPALQNAEANSTADIAQTAAQPQVARDLAAFSSAIATAKTPAQLLRDPAFLKVLLTASGLGDQVQYPALAQKALLSDTTKPNSLASQLSDAAWATTTSAYQFATKGLSVIQSPSVQQTLKQAYAEVLWRQSLDTTTPGLSNAIDFRNRASSITSVDQILSDPTFETVVLGALGIPEQIAEQDLPTQEQAITSRIDISRFKDPKFVDNLTSQYLLSAQSSSSSGSSASSLDSLAVQASGLLV